MKFFPQIINPQTSCATSYIKSSSKVVCVGRNYVEHAKELNNPVPKTPLLFIKSTNTLLNLKDSITIPQNLGECHHELEIAILMGDDINQHSSLDEVNNCIKGVGLGLDLTLRDLQHELKSQGQPWERAKSFDGSCPVTGFIDSSHFESLTNIDFCLIKNDLVAQQGNSQDMIFNIIELILNISKSFSLYQGDIILTGTPKGVASLNLGDKIALKLNQKNIANAIIS